MTGRVRGSEGPSLLCVSVSEEGGDGEGVGSELFVYYGSETSYLCKVRLIWKKTVIFQSTKLFYYESRKREVNGDVTHGGLGGFVSCPYFFPQHCIPYRLSVGTGLFTNHF
jgi:hypothetical protein